MTDAQTSPPRGRRPWLAYGVGAVLVVGIVVAIAVPAPADKVFFMELEWATRHARECADRVRAFAAASGAWPADAPAAGCASASGVVQEVRVDQGAVLVRLRKGGQAGGALVRLDPFQDEAGLKAAAPRDAIRFWKCSSADPGVQRRLPKSCRREAPA